MSENNWKKKTKTKFNWHIMIVIKKVILFINVISFLEQKNNSVLNYF